MKWITRENPDRLNILHITNQAVFFSDAEIVYVAFAGLLIKLKN